MDASDYNRIRSYLGYNEGDDLLSTNPAEFLKHNLLILPPELLQLFSKVLNPKQRTVIPAIRNRRLKYTQGSPLELSWTKARNCWPLLWEGKGRDLGQGQEERQWAKNEFMGGGKKPFVGNLGDLLADYEEEREAERIRTLKRQKAEQDAALPEEDEETDSDEEEAKSLPPEEPSSEQELKGTFELLIKERFIYGLLEGAEYDAIDWDDKWDDQNFADLEERWFEEEEEE